MLPVAPGVYTRIIDESFYVAAVPGTAALFPVISERGPDNVLTLVTTRDQLLTLFGSFNYSRYGQTMYNAFNFLGFSGNAFLIRPLPTVEDTADLLGISPTGVLTGKLPIPTQFYPWVNKPATFAGCVMGYIKGKDGITEHTYNDLVIRSSFRHEYTEAQTRPVDIDLLDMNYRIGYDELLVYLNGEELDRVDGVGYVEIGLPNTRSNTIRIFRDINVGDILIVLRVNKPYLEEAQLRLASPTDRYIFFTRYPNLYGDIANPQILSEKLEYEIIFDEHVLFMDHEKTGNWERLGPFPIDLGGESNNTQGFRYVPGLNQIVVKHTSGGVTRFCVPKIDYKEDPTGFRIIFMDDVLLGDKIEIIKHGIVPLVRYRQKFLDPVTDTVIDHNIRSVATTLYKMENMPPVENWLKNYWTYGETSIQNTQLDECIFTPLVIFAGKGRGNWYNNLSIRMRPILNMDKHFELIVQMTEPLFGTTVALETFVVSLVPESKAPSGDSTFIEDVINNYSNYIMCYCNVDELLRLSKIVDPITTMGYVDMLGQYQVSDYYDPTIESTNTVLDRICNTFYTVDYILRQSDYRLTINLRGGHEGCLYLPDGASLNFATVIKCFYNALLGLYDNRVIDPEDNDIFLVYDADLPKPIKDAMIEMAKIRGDVFVNLDLPKAVSAQQAIQLRNSQYSYNTYIASLYAPHTKIYSANDGKSIVVSPTYHMSYITPYSDSVAEIWAADAGPQRGNVVPVERLMFSSTKGELDQLYINQINPIVFKNKRYMMYGQLTTQRKASALQDKNIVRLILYLNKIISRALSELLFEWNDPITWNIAENAVKTILAEIKNRRGLYSYSVKAGATDYELVTKTFHVNVIIMPTRIVEKIMLNFIVR